MKVFDFDNTIYDGESAYDFFKFCLSRKKSLIKYMPEVMYNLGKYKAGKIGMDEVYAFCDKMMGVFFEHTGGCLVDQRPDFCGNLHHTVSSSFTL